MVTEKTNVNEHRHKNPGQDESRWAELPAAHAHSWARDVWAAFLYQPPQREGWDLQRAKGCSCPDIPEQLAGGLLGFVAAPEQLFSYPKNKGEFCLPLADSELGQIILEINDNKKCCKGFAFSCKISKSRQSLLVSVILLNIFKQSWHVATTGCGILCSMSNQHISSFSLFPFFPLHFFKCLHQLLMLSCSWCDKKEWQPAHCLSTAFVSVQFCTGPLLRSFQVLDDGTSLLLLLMKIIRWCSEVPKHIPFLAQRWNIIKCRCFLIQNTDENVL